MKNTKMMNLPIEKLEPHKNLNGLDIELLGLMGEMYTTKLNSPFSSFVIKHGLSYLDALCSIRFDICPREDRRQIAKVLKMILKKTNELVAEAEKGL